MPTMLTNEQKSRLQTLINGERAPATGMEKHFLKVIQGAAIAASVEEKEWFKYWQASISAISTLTSPAAISPKEECSEVLGGTNGSNGFSGSRVFEKILNTESYGKYRGCFICDSTYGDRWKLSFYFKKVRLGIEICNENSELTDVLLKQLERDLELEKLHITLLRLSDSDIFGDRKILLKKLHNAWISASNTENRRVRKTGSPADKAKKKQSVSSYGGGWTSLGQGVNSMGDGCFEKQKISEGIAGDRDAVDAMRKADSFDMKKRSRGD
jgi:hypothetical protein